MSLGLRFLLFALLIGVLILLWFFSMKIKNTGMQILVWVILAMPSLYFLVVIFILLAYAVGSTGIFG